MIPRLCITPGEPAGIGPDIALMAANQPWAAELILIGDLDTFEARAKLLHLPIQFIPFDPTIPARPHTPRQIKILSIPQAVPTQIGQMDSRNARYVLGCLDIAVQLCQNKIANGIVTGPVHKGTINAANIAFTGHTEYLAQLTQSSHAVMLFVTPQIRVALATTHLPLSKVPGAITPELLNTTLSILNADLKKKFHIKNPRILICGLNPHAGENGYLGREEIDIIIPTLNTLRKNGFNIIGPVSADTAFTPKQLENVDAVLAMYHDQALPVIKYAGFGTAVNVTLGIPLIRTSVDHGVAIDLAGTQQANPSSLITAIKLAIELCQYEENKQ